MLERMEDASERFDEYMKSNPDWWADVLHSLLHLQHSSVPRVSRGLLVSVGDYSFDTILNR